MKRPNRKDYINKATKVQLIADQELYIDYLESKIKQLMLGGVVGRSEQLCPKCKSLNVEMDYGLGEIYCHDCEDIVGA
jgi:uncharacterized Zn finger protein (UPF0148 family)